MMSVVPKLELTNLFAAHRLRPDLWEPKSVCQCGHWEFPGEGSDSAFQAHAEHLALVTEECANEQAAKLAEAVKGLWTLIIALDNTADGLGDWHDATEYVEWASKEVRKIYLCAASEAE